MVCFKLLSTPLGGCLYLPSFLSKEDGNLLGELLCKVCNFSEFYMPYRETLIELPRKIDYFGEKDYSYSGITHKAKPFNSSLLGVKKLICENEEITKVIKKENLQKLNSCLLNFYEDGNSKLAFHSDDEKELGPNNRSNILVVSLSLGDVRTFSIRPKRIYQKQLGKEEIDHIEMNIDLKHGSLLVMYGDFQHKYEHAILKSTERKNPRLNLTWRVING